MRPRAQLEAQTDGTTVECIYKVVNVQPERIVTLIHRSGNAYKNLCKICINSPIAKLICFCKSVSWDCVSYPAVIKLVRNRIKTVFNIPKAFPLCKLCKTHDIKMISAREIPDAIVSSVSLYAFIKFVFWYHIHELCKYCFSSIHGEKCYCFALNIKNQIVEKIHPYNLLIINNLNNTSHFLTGH